MLKKNMNQKGFSLIEVMTTFILVSTILIMLVELLLSLKNIYKTGDLKTTLLINQANMERKINADVFNTKNLTLTSCGTNCLSITTDNGIKELKIENNSIIYDGYSMQITSGSKIGDIVYSNSIGTIDDNEVTIYKIDISITNNLVPGDYGIHIISQVG